ncbi:hypothetical protein PVAND_007538 [Polypedilum vanderplanki]|uniref:CCA tRNA nucleotidyltransferase 1, mitochondrial n=1 Tax=Polypedilum vanderplanki TaxID=319348 RepID=A0A9J6C7M5_POLVA|nr:hypothetical protein PVAND_007538 [Polypedilum vanderplanki]
MDPNIKYRKEPFVHHLKDKEVFKSIFTPELNTLLEIFKKYNYEIRLAGGPVRDLILDIRPTDLDFATTATPAEMKNMFTEENIRMINTNGEKHGTITARINEENYECTTLRIDVVTDGRHAQVEFTKDWLLDANRRDLTINSMFLDFEGTIYDHFFGYEDLMARKIRFVGIAERRIQEDYLRILRYFRFFGRITTDPHAHDEDTINAIKENVQGLQSISGERLWVELKKILQGNYADDILTKILECGIAKYIGLPSDSNLQEFDRVKNNKLKDIDYQPITILASLLNNSEDAFKLHERLKFSAFDRDLLYFIVKHREVTKDADLKHFQKLCLSNDFGKPKDIKNYVHELLKYHCNKETYENVNNWKIPYFPVNGTMLKENNCPAGKFMGHVMIKLKTIWANNDFNMSAEELITHLPKVISELDLEKGVKKQKLNE